MMRLLSSEWKASVSVYCSLTFLVLLSLILLLMEGARKNGQRFAAEYAINVGMDSILAEYHREMYKQYNLLLIDTAYGTQEPSLQKTASHLRKYVEKNLNGAPLYGLNQVAIVMENPAYLSDEKGKLFERLAIEERKEASGSAAVTDILFEESRLDRYEEEKKEWDKEREKAEKEIENASNQEVVNPAGGINTARGSGVLFLAVDNTETLSNASLNPEGLCSKRGLQKGYGVRNEKFGKETIFDKQFFLSYLNTYFGAYQSEKDESVLKYEREYLLCGKSGDLENLEGVASRILAVREAANVEFLMTDSVKKAEIEAMAMSIATAAAMPELTQAIAASITFAWAFAESVVDIRTLFSDGKVPLVKTAASWKTDLLSALENACTNETNSCEEGLKYEEYLTMFLEMEPEEILSMRALDLMEENIRKTQGNENFRLDGCMDSVEISVQISDGNHEQIYLERVCEYE